MNKRKELYDAIVKYNLQDVVKSKYGRNYTQVGSAQLEEIINAHTSKVEKAKPVTKKCNGNTTKLDKLIKVLSDKRIILKSELEFINKED